VGNLEFSKIEAGVEWVKYMFNQSKDILF